MPVKRQVPRPAAAAGSSAGQPSSSPDGDPGRWHLPALIAGAALLLFPSLYYPFGRDQGVFATVGCVILDGGLPYRDVWELKPPGVYYTYAAMLAATGRSMAGVRALDLAVAVVTACLLYWTLHRLIGCIAAWLGSLLYAALYLRLGFWGMAQAESYANLWTALALFAWLGAGRTAPVGAGLAGAAALLLKVTALPPLAAALVAISLLRGRESGWAPESKRWAGFLLGLSAVLELVAIAMAVSGAGAAYVEIQQGFVAGYVALAAERASAANAGWGYFWRLYAIPVVLAGAGLGIAQPAARLLLGSWLAAAFLSVSMQQKYFGYHWTPVLLPLAGLAGVGMAGLLSPLRRRHRRSAGALAAAGALLIAGWSLEREANGYRATYRLLTGQISRERFWSRFGWPHQGDFSFLADVWAARYIRTHTRPEEPVYIWGFEPLTLFLADRRAPTRFIFAVPLVSPWTPARWRAELMRDLRARPPVLFGVMRRDAIPHASGRRDDSATQLERFPELRSFLRRHYVYETTIEDLTLYRLREPAKGGRGLKRPLPGGERQPIWP